MKESWKNTNDLNESLGDDFDVAAGWEAFNKPKDKKRPILFWFWGALSVMGLALILCFFNNQDKQELNPLLSNDTSQKLINDDRPSIAYSSSNKQLNGKDTSKEPAKDTPIYSSITPQQITKKTQNYTVKNSAQVAKKSILQNQGDVLEYLSDNRVESILQNSPNTKIKNILKNGITSEKTTPATLKSTSRKESDFNPLSSIIKPLIIEQTGIPPHWDNFSNQKTIPLNAKKTRSFNLAYTYNRPKREIKGNEEMYQDLRQNGEQFLEQQQIDFTVTQTFNRSFFLSVGLTYGRYRSRLVEKIQELRSPIVYNDVIIETHTQNNITNELRGTAIGSQLSINQSTRFQVYQTLSIPVQLGMHIRLKRDWQLSLGTGIALNVWQQTKGNTYASTLPDGKFTPVASLGYRSAGTIENISTLQIQKKIAKQLNLHLGLQAKFDLNNRMKKEIGVSDKWKSYGLSIGISKEW